RDHIRVEIRIDEVVILVAGSLLSDIGFRTACNLHLQVLALRLMNLRSRSRCRFRGAIDGPTHQNECPDTHRKQNSVTSSRRARLPFAHRRYLLGGTRARLPHRRYLLGGTPGRYARDSRTGGTSGEVPPGEVREGL